MLSCGGGCLANFLARRTKKDDDEEALALAKRVLASCSDSKPLMKAFEEAVAGSERLERVASRLKTSRALDVFSLRGIGSRRLEELVRIVAFGVGSGSSSRKQIALFAAKLEHELRMRNRLRAKTNGMQALTYMGMGVFFPLFSGISAVILSNSLGLFEKSAMAASSGFLLTALSYVPMILYLTSAFAHPERNAGQNVLAIIPYFSLASLVVYATQTYIANIL